MPARAAARAPSRPAIAIAPAKLPGSGKRDGDGGQTGDGVDVGYGPPLPGPSRLQRGEGGVNVYVNVYGVNVY